MQPALRNGPRVLVLGAGFIGATVATVLARRGQRVTVLVRSQPTAHTRARLNACRIVRGDIETPGLLESLVSDTDHVVFALGSASPAASAQDPTAQATGELVPLLRVLEVLRAKPDPDLTYFSSGGTVYGHGGAEPIPENTPTNPVSGYGILKVTCERYLRLYSADHGVRCRVLRIANAYGPGQPSTRSQGLIAKLLHAAHEGMPIPVFGDGCSIRDYVYVDDIAEVVGRLLGRVEPFEVFNVGSGTGQSILSLVQMVHDVTGRELALEFRESRSFDVAAIVLDSSAVIATTGYRPRSVADGLLQTWLQSPAPVTTLADEAAWLRTVRPAVGGQTAAC